MQLLLQTSSDSGTPFIKLIWTLSLFHKPWNGVSSNSSICSLKVWWKSLWQHGWGPFWGMTLGYSSLLLLRTLKFKLSLLPGVGFGNFVFPEIQLCSSKFSNWFTKNCVKSSLTNLLYFPGHFLFCVFMFLSFLGCVRYLFVS